MKVYLVPSDNTGCGHYRMLYPMRALQETQASVDIEIVRDKIEPGEDVVVVFQRPTEASVAYETIPYLQSRGYAVAVEVDDNLSKIDPKHAGFWFYHPSYNKDANWKHLEECCRQADLVICTTPGLIDQYAPHGRAAMIPNYVPAKAIYDRYHWNNRRTEDGRNRVGWAGIVNTHPGDLDVAARGVRRIVNGGWMFSTLGTRDALPALGLVQGADAEVRPYRTSIEEYYPELRRYDIGIVPLSDIRFNQDKSWLKGMEYSSQGVPWVASATGPYKSLAALGGGVVVEGPKDWERVLKDLADNPNKRRDLADDGIKMVRQLSLEENAWRWEEAWCRARREYERHPLSPEAQAMLGTSRPDLAVI